MNNFFEDMEAKAEEGVETESRLEAAPEEEVELDVDMDEADVEG